MMRKLRAANESGFTLVELLVVIIIIGILAAIAIPVFLNQRKRANDADLKQSMRNIAQAYNEWTIEPANSNAQYESLAGGRRVFVEGEGQTLYPVPEDAVFLEDLPGMTPAKVKPKTVFELMVVKHAYATGWTIAHEEDEFCIVGRMENSNYNYRSNNGQTWADYDKLLYWDSNLGGLKEMKDMVKATEEGQRSSCYYYVNRYLEFT